MYLIRTTRHPLDGHLDGTSVKTCRSWSASKPIARRARDPRLPDAPERCLRPARFSISGCAYMARLTLSHIDQEGAEMLRSFAATVATLALLALPVAAQTPPANTPGQGTAPSGQNSGAGVPGLPGNKSGPAVRSPSGTSGAATGSTSQQDPSVRQQDTSKVPGMPGSKSGPAERPPSGR